MILTIIVRHLTGREYRDIKASDLAYMLQKGGGSYLRGFLWAIFHARRGRGLMLGRNIKFVASGRLTLGRGVSIGHNAYLDCSGSQGVILEDGVTIREFAWLQCRSGLNANSGRVCISAKTYIGPFAVLGASGEVLIGDKCQIGARFTVSAESHIKDAQGSFVAGNVSRCGVKIGNECWIGNNVCVIDGVTIGDRCVIGAGSVVTRDIPADSKAFGVPARIVASLK